MNGLLAKMVRINCDCYGGGGVHYIDAERMSAAVISGGATQEYCCPDCVRVLMVFGRDGRAYVTRTIKI